MPRGDKDKYTDKQKRKAEHIAEGYEESGVSEEEAKSRAWATVNKESGGGNKSGSGRGKKDTHVSSSRSRTVLRKAVKGMTKNSMTPRPPRKSAKYRSPRSSSKP